MSHRISDNIYQNDTLRYISMFVLTFYLDLSIIFIVIKGIMVESWNISYFVLENTALSKFNSKIYKFHMNCYYNRVDSHFNEYAVFVWSNEQYILKSIEQ